MFQCIGLSYLTFALSAFLWHCETGREVQAVDYYQLKVVCHFSFAECASNRPSYLYSFLKRQLLFIIGNCCFRFVEFSLNFGFTFT